eukprot:Gb_04171 [translate_table: standard]
MKTKSIVKMKMAVMLMLITVFYPNNVYANNDGWDWIGDLQDMDGLQFMESIYPIIQMAANAYRYPSSVPIPGWRSASLVPPMAPPHGGAHALAYEQKTNGNGPSNPIVIAFRGTQISSTQDAMADVCADMLLWEGLEFESLPAECSIFTNSTLDYFSQALNFTETVLEAYPGCPLLLTGHSLGAGLAILVSAALSDVTLLPVIGFSAPGTKAPLQKRSLHLKAGDEGSVFTIGNEWDEVMRTQWEGQVGVLCLYHTVETQACVACFSNSSSTDGYRNSRLLLSSNYMLLEKGQNNVLPEGGDCQTCFFQTHILKRLIEVVKEGNKPICQQTPSKDEASE